MMRKFRAEELPPVEKFYYHQGVFLSGMYHIYALCKGEKYIQYIKDWVDSTINEKGEIAQLVERQLDDIQAGILLYPLWERTGDGRYRTALETLLPLIYHFLRNPVGGFWHTSRDPHQMWLDGLYMAGPISAEYAVRFQHPEYLEHAHRGYEAVIRSLDWDGKDVLVGNICIGTAVGDYQYDINRPTCVNDLHGAGAFLLMCAEAAKSQF